MSTLDGTAQVPVVGKVQKKYLAVAGVAAVGVVAAVWYRRSRVMTEAAGGGGYYADTRTGSNLPTDTAADSGSIDTGDQGDDGGWKAPRTDQEWAQQVLERLSWYEQGFVSSVVAKYLAGQPITSPDEQTVIREAWAQVGTPPGGQRLITSPTSNPTPPPTTTPAKPTTKPGYRELPAGTRPTIPGTTTGRQPLFQTTPTSFTPR